ncbi:flagellar hook-length control protein FliK [Campylobacter sp. MIT 99-7217]|uniref:flagellar hook-length control protein FliK n=1 Tax=Campylobacter sp. MIT 99-7217 TaxID=535091 RepID=UPI001157D6F3|nr:flagellar hook-length control protein FliK [Campylobacter sp. MIT 99-7217]TQR32952.1 flagellar hook-length control protein FliK [Campylobacter sp. MIT 99-7217]
MINTQISNNASSNLNKADLKLDNKENQKDTKTSLKETKELTQSLKNNLGLSQTKELPQALSFDDTKLNLQLKQLVNKLLDQITSKNNPNPNILKQGDKLNFALNFGHELKFLSKEMSKDSIFSEVLSKLEQILKPASAMKNSADLTPLLKNSGVFFESKLKNALNPENLPKSFHMLLNTIKTISSPKITNEIIALANKELDPKASLNELKNILNTQQKENSTLLKDSGFKTLLDLSAKLENFKKYISKNPSIAQEKIAKIADKILDSLNKLEQGFKQELSKPENLMLKDTKILKDLRQSFDKLKSTLKNILEHKPTSFETNKNVISKEEPKQTEKGHIKDQNQIPDKKDQINTKDEKKPQIKGEENKKTLENLKSENPKNESLKQESNTQQELKNQDIKDEHINTKEELNSKEVLKNPKEDTKANSTPKQTELKEELKAPATNQEQESIENTPLQEENHVQEEKLEQGKDQNKSLKEETIKENSSKTNTTQTKEPLKENIKEDIANNAQKKSVQETSNEVKNTAQERPANNVNTNLGEIKTPQNSQNLVKNLIFSTEKLQMQDLENLNKAINELSRKINQGLKQLDANANTAKTNLADIKNLNHRLENAIKDLAQITPKDEAQIAKEIKNDIKSTLLQISNLAKESGNESVATTANRLLTQIELNQLMSLANDSINTSLPLEWEDLNESKIIFRRGKKDKYFARIKLNFASLGELDVLLALNNDKYLDINIMAENKEFRKRIYENAHELKRNINKVGLLNSNFFVGDIIRSQFDNTSSGRSYDFEMGIDKKA